MKITGQILKENREKKGISISEVALATKINNKTLIAMEEGNIDNLPPKTFLRGFVRAYAGYLGLDVEQILNTFYEEMGTTKPKIQVRETETSASAEPSSNDIAAPLRKASTSDTPQTKLVKMATVGGIVLLIIIIIIIKNKMDSYERESVTPEVPVAIGTVQPDASASPSAETSPTPADPSMSPSPTAAAAVVAPTASPSPSPSASPSPTPKPSATAKPTATPQPSPTASPTPTPKPSATPKPSPSPKPSASPSPTPTPTPSASPKPSATPSSGRTQEIIIEALDTVEVIAQIDGEPEKTFKLKTDQIQNIKAKRKVILKLTDGGAVNIILNGVDRGVPGDLGKPYRLELP